MNKTWMKSMAVTGLSLVLAGNIGLTLIGNSRYEAAISALNTELATLQQQLATQSALTTLSTTDSLLSVSALAEKVIPSVVGIEVTAQVTVNYGPYGSRTALQSGSGSGIVYSSDGFIITNYHVVEAYAVNSTGGSLTVITSDGTSYTATYVEGDETSDLAVLKIEATNLTPAEFGSSSSLLAGDFAMAIGYPLGMDLASSVTVGVISGVDRNIASDTQSESLIQTDAAINPGNSGGALVNALGQVIGITNAKIATTSVEGIGFAIPIDDALPIIESLINASK